ncbi:glutathione S-transferase [Ancylobacter sp. 3268]|uniref:glutathione S-transferase family protein n=1 Tax=Ancylobacter sp. 3268 TaxID=2817752 RepID=UPI002862CB06|nr:glutathione S-transferase family protein [Ancylobacter sp. 3268]MDR6954299.1 glutathione S-transferase [Ancylobacter sp. 3268]
MRLIGMLDSPYVRRVAISLKFLRLPFAHEAVSVFRHFDAFAAINPVVKAPTFITDAGVTLMDSTLILAHVERLADPALTLEPADSADHARAQRIVGLALAACEKTVQIVYEHELRPQEKRHEPWLARVRGQLHAAYGLLEAEIDADKGWLFGERPMQADITAAVALGFTRLMLPGEIEDARIPALASLAARAEALAEFTGTPML